MYYGKFNFFNIKEILPEGWLKEFLLRQMDGLTGHLDEVCEPFTNIRWGDADVKEDKYDKCADDVYNNTNWWGYEQVAYWVDGYNKTAKLLGLSQNKVSNQLYGVLKNQDTDGYLGPKFSKSGNERIRWPHTVFFRALLTEYEFTKDKDIIDKLTQHYLNDTFIYDEFRDVTNIEIMLYLYSINNEKKLLDKSVQAYESYFEKAREENSLHGRVNLEEEKPYNHGVTYNEISKLGAILYSYTGNERYLNDSVRQYQKIDKYFLLPNGCMCSNEFMIDDKYYQCTEMCDVSDYTHSLRYMLAVTGNGEYGDKIERCVFNAGIGAVTEDFKAIQYLSCANQVLATDNSCHNFFHKGGNWMKFNSDMEVKCCLGNSNRFMPEYITAMWMQSSDGIAAALYGASEFCGIVNGKKVNIVQETEYPFEDQVRFRVLCQEDNHFSFSLRIPSWVNKFAVTINGTQEKITPKKGFISINRTWKNDDVISLSFDIPVETVSCGKGKIYFRRGSLIFSIGDSGQRLPDGDFGSTQMRIKSKWNYAVDTFSYTFNSLKSSEYPWEENNCPFFISVSAYEINGWNTEIINDGKIKNVWNLYEKKYNYVKGDFEFTPRIPSVNYIRDNMSDKPEEIKLVPFGVAKMRMTVLPKK